MAEECCPVFQEGDGDPIRCFLLPQGERARVIRCCFPLPQGERASVRGKYRPSYLNNRRWLNSSSAAITTT